MKTWKQALNIWMAIFAIAFSNPLFCQQDSSAKVINDSLVLQQQSRTELLKQQADSIHIADSLQQLALLDAISKLKTNDELQKQALQRRLDSLKTTQEKRSKALKAQVDSLRSNTPGYPVVIYNDTLFYIYAKLGPFIPADRAKGVTQKIENLVSNREFDSEALHVYEDAESADVMHGEIILFSITDRDAFWLEKSKLLMAEDYMNAINDSVIAYKKRTDIWHTLLRIALLLGVLALFYFGIKWMNKGFTWLNLWVIAKGKPYLKGVQFRNYEFLSAERELQLAKWILKVLKWFAIILVVYLSLPVIFSIFPATQGVATTLFSYILNPIKNMVSSFLGYIPELITIAVIIAVTHYFTRFLRFLSLEVAAGKLVLPGFYADWAAPTYNLLKIVIYAFSFIIIFPYLPGSDSPVFQGVSVFLGLIVSLGSSSAISNIIAGLVITYMRAFKISDRVKIGDTTGDVIEKTMLVTRVKTIKNEVVTIPNSAILYGSTINYTRSGNEYGLILNSTVTIGYDVPWRDVHEMLIGAANETDLLKKDPKPFVFQTSLDDFYVSYQINAYTDHAESAAKIYSELHSKIQDAFNKAGVEILSPHYRAARDGNTITLPPDYLPPNYKASGFNVNVNKGNS